MFVWDLTFLHTPTYLLYKVMNYVSGLGAGFLRFLSRHMLYMWDSPELSWWFIDFTVLLLGFDFKAWVWIPRQDHAFALESSERFDLGDKLCVTATSYTIKYDVSSVCQTPMHATGKDGQWETLWRSSRSPSREIIMMLYYSGAEQITTRRNAVSWEMVSSL